MSTQSKQYQRVYVTTHPDRPYFLVHRMARDVFIDELVFSTYGAQPNGEMHEWEAFDLELLDQAEEQRCPA